MKDISHMNKNGVSEIISYVILIVIAISIGALVYTYLYKMVPKNHPECKEGISLSIENYTCEYNYLPYTSRLNLTVKNRGRFNIEASYIRIGNLGNRTKYLINSESTNKFQYAPILKPNGPLQQTSYEFNTTKILKDVPGNYELEIQIAYYDKETKKYAACENAITQVINCG